VLKTGPMVIPTSVGQALSASNWNLCDVCAEALESGRNETVRMYIRSNNTHVHDSETLKEATADVGIEILNALRREHQEGAQLIDRS
jgi:hypothetical protein